MPAARSALVAVVALTGAALTALGLPAPLGTPAGAITGTGADTQAAPRTDAPLGIETLGPVAVTTGTGAAVADIPPSMAVLPEGVITNGAQPILFFPVLRDKGTVPIRLIDPAVAAGGVSAGVVWTGELRDGFADVSARLRQGYGYRVELRAPDGTWTEGGSLSVAGVPEPEGPSATVGGISVSQVTGNVSWGWQSEVLAGPISAVAAGLGYSQTTRTSAPGLPRGWTMALSTGSPWASLAASDALTTSVTRPTAITVRRTDDDSARVSYGSTSRPVGTDGYAIRVRAAGEDWRVVARPEQAGSVEVPLPDTGEVDVQVGVRAEGTVVWAPPLDVPETPGDVQQRTRVATAPPPLPALVRVVGWDGTTVSFVRNALGVYEQVSASRRAPGFVNTLSRDADGVWRLTDAQGLTTTFVDGRARSVLVDGREASRLVWDQSGRVTRLINEIGRELRFRYADAGTTCESSGWTQYGFAAVPAGMLCGIDGPATTDLDIGYVAVGDEVQIALLKQPGNVGLALGWDSRGRLVSERGTLVMQAATMDPSVRGALSTLVSRVVYDRSGRAGTLVEQPAAVGVAGLTSDVRFASITATALREAAAAPADDPEAGAVIVAVSVRGDFPLRQTLTVDPISMTVIKQTDAAGITLSQPQRERDVTRTRDAANMVTIVETDELGFAVRQSGPFRAGGTGPVSTRDFDTVLSKGDDEPLVGLRAIEYTQARFGGTASDAFWPADRVRGALSRTWSGRPTAWSGQAQGVWLPSDEQDEAAKGEWTFEVKASGGTNVRLVVGTTPCVPDQRDMCVIRQLPKGPKSLTVEIPSAGATGWFEVRVAPGTGPVRAFAPGEVRPGFGLNTVERTNDAFGRAAGRVTRTSYADPASGRPSSITAPGGLVTTLEYETAGWQRITSRTTPGGEVVRYTYWPDDAQVALPQLCGAGDVRVSGQRRTTVRQDGTRVTSYPDVSGKLIAETVADAAGDAGQTQCISYADDGSVRSSRTFNAAGELVESLAVDGSFGGDPRVRRTTIRKGPGAPVGAGAVDITTVRTDLRGNTVELTDGSGVRTETTFNLLDLPTATTVTPPIGTPVTFAQTYRRLDAQLASVRVDGVVAATLDYDTAGRPQAFAWADGAVRVTMNRAETGRPSRLVARVGADTYTSQLELTAFGRVVGTRATGPGFSRAADYRFDSAGRLARATITAAQPGVPAETVFDYGYGATSAAACPGGDAGVGSDALRTTGARNGVEYVSCYANGRLTSTTDPLIDGGGQPAQLRYDRLGRVVRISGAEDPLSFDWDTSGTIARVVQGGAAPMTVTQTSFGGVVRDRVLSADGGISRVREGGGGLFQLAFDADGDLTTLVETRYSLPGGAQVSIPAGGTATLQIPGLDGSTLATVPVPVLGAGVAATGVGPGAAYGPYGEPLVTPTLPQSAVPMYGWRTAPGAPTLPGTAAITVLGARAYLPATGLFLSPDPLVDAGTNMYSYTTGDPVNFSDAPGTEETPTYLAAAGFFLGALGAFLAALYGRGAIGTLIGIGSVAASGVSFAVWTKSSDDPALIVLNGLVGAAIAATAGLGGAVARLNGFGAGRVRAASMSTLSRGSAATKVRSSAPRSSGNVANDEVTGSLLRPRGSAAGNAARLSNRTSVVSVTEGLDDVASLKGVDFKLPKQLKNGNGSLKSRVLVRQLVAPKWKPSSAAMEFDFATGTFVPMKAL